MSNDWGGDDWGQGGDDWGTSGAGGRPASGRPTAVPPNSGLGVDDIQLEREDRPMDPTSGAISSSWERVKEKPFETILLAFLSMIFGQGGGGCNNLGNLVELIQTDSGTESQEYEYGGSIFDSASGAIGDLVGNIGAAELGVIAVIVAVVLVLIVVMTVLNTLVQGASSILWMRLHRGQSAELGHTTAVTRFFVMLLVTNILYGLAIFGGFLMLIIPAFIFIYGFMFAGYVVVDKNLGYVDALKASWRLTDGYKLNIFVLAVLLGLLNFAGMLMCCVGVFVTHAVGMGAMAYAYDKLAAPGNAYLDAGEEYANVFE